MNGLIFQVNSLSSYVTAFKKSQAWDSNHSLHTLSHNFNDLTHFGTLILASVPWHFSFRPSIILASHLASFSLSTF